MATLEDNSKHSGLSCCHQSGSETVSTDGDSIELDYTNANNNSVYYGNNENKVNGYSFPKRESVNLSFKDVRYSIKSLAFNRNRIGFERKEILHGISGEFASGKLTAIMGPSGAGKSTLLNIMAGYVCRGVDGTIKVNGKIRPDNSEEFRKLSCYIHQDDELRVHLTVKEAMMIATHLKLGYDITMEEKTALIKKILVLLGLDKRYNTYTGKLSGGQRKRLAIALEMISNPPVLFLDEPTTGLDSSSCTQCIALLKRLAQEGRTIICTIHQPSALLFEMFDNLYALSQGHCIYQGRVKELIPFLNDLELNIPAYHNPADFLIEVAIGEYGSDIPKMVAAAIKKSNADSDFYFIREKSVPETPNLTSIVTNHKTDNKQLEYEYSYLSSIKNIIKNNNPNNNNANNNSNELVRTTNQCKLDKTKKVDEEENFEDKSEIVLNRKCKNASILRQIILLYKRNIISIRRNYFLIIARMVAHILIGAIFGYLYVDVGPTANTAFGNYAYLYGSILLIVYTGKMSVMMSFPIEMNILKREHFNRWYNLGPYYFSVVLFEIPFQMICASLYVCISYWLTGNFYEWHRFFCFLGMCLASTLCAQAWGFLVGATLPVKIAVFVGPVLAVLFSVFGFFTGYSDMPPLFRWMWHISYFRAGFHSIINTVYGMERPFLKCPDTELYCHFINPKVFLKEVMIDSNSIDMNQNIGILTTVFILAHFFTLVVLWFKLNKR